MNSLNDTREQMTEEQITRAVIQPLASALRELSSRGIVHGDIRPTNIFLRDQDQRHHAGGVRFRRHLLRAGAAAADGRAGDGAAVGAWGGTTADDLYALGVTILLLFMGRNPVRQLDDEAMLQAKIDRGTYPALVGTSRISLNLMEPLRGMLADDPKLRWSLNDLELWLSGRRLSPRRLRCRARPPGLSTGGDSVLALPRAGAGLRLQSCRGSLVESGDWTAGCGAAWATKPGRRPPPRSIRRGWRGGAPISKTG